MANEGIHVTGIPELSRALKAINPEALKELKKAWKSVATYVVKNAQGRMEFGGGTAASSVKASGTMKGAAIRYPKGGAGSGRDADGYYPWLDFGGAPATGRGVTAHSRRQAGAGVRRAVLKEGRYIYPAIAAARESGYIEKEATVAIEKAARATGFETRGM